MRQSNPTIAPPQASNTINSARLDDTLFKTGKKKVRLTERRYQDAAIKTHIIASLASTYTKLRTNYTYTWK